MLLRLIILKENSGVGVFLSFWSHHHPSLLNTELEKMQQAPFCSIWYRQALCPSIHKTEQGIHAVNLDFAFFISSFLSFSHIKALSMWSLFPSTPKNFYTSLQRNCHCQQSRALNSTYIQPGINCHNTISKCNIHSCQELNDLISISWLKSFEIAIFSHTVMSVCH